jgi:hypothetical protein
MASAQTQATPKSAEQETMITAMRQYAKQYVAKLPNFVCIQVTQQFKAGKKPAHWHQGDTLTSKLVFVQGHEERSLESVNNKTPKPDRLPRAPLVSEGEFGTLLPSILDPESSASFRWNGWQVIRGNRLAVFDYSIDGAHSTVRISLNDSVSAVISHHGSVYGDPQTGAVWRVTSEASDIPSEVETKTITRTIDYDRVGIGSESYLLPAQASVALSTGISNIRNDIQFKDYRKFEADSTITYSPATVSTLPLDR